MKTCGECRWFDHPPHEAGIKRRCGECHPKLPMWAERHWTLMWSDAGAERCACFEAREDLAAAKGTR